MFGTGFGNGLVGLQKILSDFGKRKSVLRKKPYFDKSSHLKRNDNSNKQELHFKKASEDVVQEYKNKFQKRRKKSNIILVSILIVFAVIAGMFALNKPNENAFENYLKSKIHTTQKNPLASSIKKYEFLINDGDQWLSRKHFKNAVFQYQEAIKIYPESKAVRMRLNKTFKAACIATGEYCDEMELIKVGS